jgi:nicotinamide-nucleotide amidase
LAESVGLIDQPAGWPHCGRGRVHVIAEIIATGDEIRSGALVDSNSAYIAGRLEETGVAVVRHTCMGDDLAALAALFKECAQRCDVVVVTGGLGPTTDDLSAEAAARAAGVELCLDPSALETVERFFKARQWPMSDSNRKQAFLPAGAECLDNPVGTAPGFSLLVEGCRYFFLPGVPYEMKKMLTDQVLPRIQAQQGDQRQYCLVRTISTFGLPESVAGEKVAPVTRRFKGLKLGLRAHFPEIQVKLYTTGDDEPGLTVLLQEATAWVVKQLEPHVLSTAGDPMEKVVGDLLRERGATLAVAESCTGGLLAHMLTRVAGSSDYFLFSAVTYANQAKIDVLGVLPETLSAQGAVAEETARQMALGAQRVSGADWALATTGIAGPGGGTPQKPVGTVCIALAGPDRNQVRKFYFPFGQRRLNKTIFAMAALDMLRRSLLNPNAA